MVDSNVPAMTATMIVCGVVSLVFMSLRFYCKQVLGTRLALDDYVLFLSWLSLVPDTCDNAPQHAGNIGFGYLGVSKTDSGFKPF